KSGLTFLTGTGSGDPTMTFQGTQAMINLALYSLVYTPDPSYSGPASITVTVQNLSNTTGGGPQTTTTTAALTISKVNQPPTVTVPGVQTAAEDTPVVFSSGNGNAIRVGDPDAGAQPVQVTLTAARGTLTLASSSGLTFISGGLSGSSTVIVK